MDINSYMKMVQQKAPKRFQNLVKEKKERYGDNFKAMAKDARKQGKITKEQKYNIDKLASEGKFDIKSKEVDQKMAKDMKGYVDKQVNEGLRSGRLDKPDKAEYDRLSKKYGG